MSRPSSLPARRWRIAPPAPLALRQALGQHSPILLQILHNRGLASPAQIAAFLQHQYSGALDPFLLPDMEKAVARITRAADGDEIIVVYGDFDADGVTATVLLVEALRSLGLSRRQVQPYIPDRIDEGYGLNQEALTTIREERGAGLVITVDCGIRAQREVAHANALGLDLIITDHHSIGKTLPPALAIINPKRAESAYPDRMLAGVGIAYKLAEALFQALPERVTRPVEDLLDLVALGTVADLAPLLNENRQLVTQGLAVINRGQRPGLAALVASAGLTMGKLTAESIAFGLGPRINAAGRLDHAYLAARLLAAEDLGAAQPLARALNDLNRERQRLTREHGEKALALVDPQAPLIFAAGPDFIPGVVGLVASRLTENFYRPAVVIEVGQEESRGSCRSIPEFHMTDALETVADLLEHFGGHAAAAGLTVRNEHLPALQERLTELADQLLAGQDLRPVLDVDAEVALGDIDWALLELLQQLEPTGQENPTPLLAARGVEVLNHRTVGQDGHHLQLDVSDGRAAFKGIAFRQGAWAGNLPARVDIAFSLGINEWRGRRTLQLMIKDIQASADEEITT